MESCKFKQNFPSDCKEHCMAYSKAKRSDGKFWAHYPECKEKECPVKHPEILKNEKAILNTSLA